MEDFGYKLRLATKDLLEFIFKSAEEIRFRTRYAAGGLVGILEYGEGGKSVGVLIYIDVVPVSKEEAPTWKHPPFSGEIADGFI